MKKNTKRPEKKQAKPLRVLTAHELVGVAGGGKRTSVKDAHDRYTN